MNGHPEVLPTYTERKSADCLKKIRSYLIFQVCEEQFFLSLAYIAHLKIFVQSERIFLDTASFTLGRSLEPALLKLDFSCLVDCR